MGVDHGGFYIFVAEELLDGANVVTGLQEVGGEGVSEGMGGNVFVDFCGGGRLSLTAFPWHRPPGQVCVLRV